MEESARRPPRAGGFVAVERSPVLALTPWTWQRSGMTMQAIREATDAEPFRPFSLRLAGGPKIKVAHPDYIAFGPRGRTILVYGADESFKVIDVMLVTEVDVPEPRSPKR